MRWLSTLVTIVLLLGLMASELPPAWRPWTPLDLRDEPNPLTGWKLARTANDAPACLAALETAGRPVTRLPDRESDTGCELENIVTLKGAAALLPPGPTVTCPVALAWNMYERHGLQPAARAELGSRVAAVRQLGSYVCRNINHASQGRRSQHATANAIDVAGFVLADGREISVLKDWPTDGPEGRFLRAARDAACRWFRGVLGPEFNNLHRNHFHLDRGPWSTCR
jgi:hypothetical protein